MIKTENHEYEMPKKYLEEAVACGFRNMGLEFSGEV